MSRNDIQIPSSIPLFSLVLSFFLAPTQVFKHIACPFFYYSLYVLSFPMYYALRLPFFLFLFSVCLSVHSVFFLLCMLLLISIFFLSVCLSFLFSNHAYYVLFLSFFVFLLLVCSSRTRLICIVSFLGSYFEYIGYIC